MNGRTIKHSDITEFHRKPSSWEEVSSTLRPRYYAERASEFAKLRILDFTSISPFDDFKIFYDDLDDPMFIATRPTPSGLAAYLVDTSGYSYSRYAIRILPSTYNSILKYRERFKPLKRAPQTLEDLQGQIDFLRERVDDLHERLDKAIQPNE
jgi:hypothetical protein